MVANGRVKPPLLAVLMCERVIIEQDKVFSLFRVVDTINVRAVAPQMSPGAEPPQIAVNVRFDVFTKWGVGQGEFTEEMRIVLPNGVESPNTSRIPFRKPPGFHFQQIHRTVNFTVNQTGMYILRVYLDGELMSEHPFMVNLEVVPA